MGEGEPFMYSDLVVILAEVEPALASQIEESLLRLDLKGLAINFRSGIYVPFISGENENGETLIMEIITTKDNIDSVLTVLSHIFEQANSFEGCLLICTLEEFQKYKPLQFELMPYNN